MEQSICVAGNKKSKWWQFEIRQNDKAKSYNKTPSFFKKYYTGGLTGWWTSVQEGILKEIAMLGTKSQNGSKFKINIIMAKLNLITKL